MKTTGLSFRVCLRQGSGEAPELRETVQREVSLVQGDETAKSGGLHQEQAKQFLQRRDRRGGGARCNDETRREERPGSCRPK